MKTTIDIVPDNCDGLSRTQRAILRYLAARPAPVKCSALLRQLLAAPQCPDGIAAEAIDATLLLMSHPALCSRPLIDYKGNIGTDDGWIPGPAYREVTSGMGFFALLSAERSSETNDLWSPTPLPILAPACLLLGCASWELEVDDECPTDYRDQATRRLRCISLHSLGTKISVTLQCLENYRESREITECLAFLDRSRRTAIGCFEPELQELLYAGSERDHPKVMSNSFLPHGLLIGSLLSSLQCHLHSAPTARLMPACTPAGAILVVDQPACGQHLGDVDKVLTEKVGCARVDEMNTRTYAYHLPSSPSFAILFEQLCCRLPVEPLAMETYELLFASYDEPPNAGRATLNL